MFCLQTRCCFASCRAPRRAQRSGRGRSHWRGGVEMRFMSLCSGAMKMQRWLARCWRSAGFASSAATFLLCFSSPHCARREMMRTRLERYATRLDSFVAVCRNGWTVLSGTFSARSCLALPCLLMICMWLCLVLPFIYFCSWQHPCLCEVLPLHCTIILSSSFLYSTCCIP